MSQPAKTPYTFTISRIGESNIGYISVTEHRDLPFQIKRIFWTYFTPEDIVRGRHGHYKNETILVAVAGRIVVHTEAIDGKMEVFELNKPTTALYLPPLYWHTMQYSHNAVQLCLTSLEFDESDYIRDYAVFRKLSNG